MGAANIDKLVLAISGSAALSPLLCAIDAGIDIALANKEAIVAAGPVITRKLKTKKARIIPIDSEQSAIWQCLNNEDRAKIKNIYLTASGGPLRKTSRNDFQGLTVKRVLRHPRWRMGEKITVDSATLMNKGLEVLETMFLFGIGRDKIKVIIHPEAIIHSMVEFIDGVVLAQLSITDMRIPIQYALSYPERLACGSTGVDFYKLRRFNFERPDCKKFPCLQLAWRAAQEGGTLPCVLNAANEVSVEEFLKGRLNFISIPYVIERVMDRHRNVRQPDLGDIEEADTWARFQARWVIDKLKYQLVIVWLLYFGIWLFHLVIII
ncbi:MAG: 1-deoxy-D-xylulose-5-phosphate reductoisomerase [Candidatus Omnitrophica bacterium]|nr:1-deoxy-D-xylulose-5-phosphate reductoisomerase [Candidatus Omnitrophota bacterium]